MNPSTTAISNLSNLFSLDGRFVVGDFGLAIFPDKQSLTIAGRKLGPMYYIAPEMLANPSAAKGGPADVYSLAKTLWVLATGQHYPPPGEQRLDTPLACLACYMTHPRIVLLDRLIERSTRMRPEDRPTMREFTNELRAWNAGPVPVPETPNVAEIVAALSGASAAAVSSEARRQAAIGSAEELGRRLQRQLLEHLQTAFGTSGPSSDIFSGNVWDMHALGSRNVWRQEFAVRSGIPGTDPWLYSGVLIELDDSERVRLVGAHIIHPASGSHGAIVWSETMYAFPESAAQAAAVGELVNGIVAHLQEALEAYLVRMRAGGH